MDGWVLQISGMLVKVNITKHYERNNKLGEVNNQEK